MRIVLQRVLTASVEIGGEIISTINQGFVVFIAIGPSDTKKDAQWFVKKLINLRVFDDENDKMNLSIRDINGQFLVISQFTLYADCIRSRRPSFSYSAKPDYARKIYEFFVEDLKNEYPGVVLEGRFGAEMKVNLINDGPATFVLMSSNE